MNLIWCSDLFLPYYLLIATDGLSKFSMCLDSLAESSTCDTALAARFSLYCRLLRWLYFCALVLPIKWQGQTYSWMEDGVQNKMYFCSLGFALLIVDQFRVVIVVDQFSCCWPIQESFSDLSADYLLIMLSLFFTEVRTFLLLVSFCFTKLEVLLLISVCRHV